MKLITDIGNNPHTKLTLIGENNENIAMTLNYNPTQEAWYFDLQYLEFSVNNIKLVNSPNNLRQFSNKLPFGLGCFVSDGSEPYFIDDFLTGRVIINLLTESEVSLIEENIFA